MKIDLQPETPMGHPAHPLGAKSHGSKPYSLPMEPEEFISQTAWEKLSHQEQDAYYERFSESLRTVLQGRNSDRALLFADHWDDLASWTRSAWNVMLEKNDQLEARLEELATSSELSEADRTWAAESLKKARAMREHKREAEDL
jgi:hypothetical protein